MKDRVLFVDDEPNVLDGIRRQLRNRVELETATSAAAGLDLIKHAGPVRRGGLRHAHAGDGRRALPRRRSTRSRRETVRMVLTGQADLESTISAVNEGRIFRFLLKPCNSETLFGVIKNGIEQYRLVQRRETPAREHAQRHREGAVRRAGHHQSGGAAPRHSRSSATPKAPPRR